MTEAVHALATAELAEAMQRIETASRAAESIVVPLVQRTGGAIAVRSCAQCCSAPQPAGRAGEGDVDLFKLVIPMPAVACCTRALCVRSSHSVTPSTRALTSCATSGCSCSHGAAPGHDCWESQQKRPCRGGWERQLLRPRCRVLASEEAVPFGASGAAVPHGCAGLDSGAGCRVPVRVLAVPARTCPTSCACSPPPCGPGMSRVAALRAVCRGPWSGDLRSRLVEKKNCCYRRRVTWRYDCVRVL